MGEKTMNIRFLSSVGVLLLAAAGVLEWRAEALAPRDLPVLMYHNVLPDAEATDVYKVGVSEFERQMNELAAAGYSTVLPSDIYFASRGLRPLPRKPVVITFDDGYLGVAQNAEPVLARHGFRAICYAITARLGGEGDARNSFKSGPLLSTNEAAAMHARGTVVLGSHSQMHIPEPKRLAREIPDSRRELRKTTGAKTRDYSYPHGLFGYPAMYEALRKGKFRTAVVCENTMFHYGSDTNLLAIPRLSVFGGRHAVRLVSADPEKAEVVLANDGDPLPLQVMVRDRKSGRAWGSEPKRIGGGGSARYEFPSEAFSGDWTLEARDKAGLFEYLRAGID